MKRKSIRKLCYFTVLASVAFIITSMITLSPSEHEIKSKVVRIYSEKGMCSGEQVQAPSGTSYILTASHCKLLGHDGSYSITTEEGEHLERKLVAEDPNSDLLLLEGLPGVRGVPIALFSFSEQPVRAFTHGHNHDTYKSSGQILEVSETEIPLFIINTDEDASKCNTAMSKYKDVTINTIFGSARLCVLDTYEQVTTVSIAPGSSGGPVVDDYGALVGVVSASDGQGFGYLVTLVDIRAFLSGY